MTEVEQRLARAGCVAPAEEAAELMAAAGGDRSVLEAFVQRRIAGEPLAWITGFMTFSGVRIRIDPGVYVPRYQTELLVARAVPKLPMVGGAAADLCTGSGAVAVALRQSRPAARVVASDIDPLACRCAAGNGVEVYEGHLADPLPADLVGRFDVVTAVVPYVPSDEMHFLPRDVLEWEPRIALDGGPGGTTLLEAAVEAASRLLHPGGWVLLELGGDEASRLRPVLSGAGFGPAATWADEDGDVRGTEAQLLAAAP